MSFRVSPFPLLAPSSLHSLPSCHLLYLSPQILGPLLLPPAGHPIYFYHLFLPVTLRSAISRPPNLTPLPIVSLHHPLQTRSLSSPSPSSGPVLSPLLSCSQYSAHYPLPPVTPFLPLPPSHHFLHSASPSHIIPPTSFALYPLPVPATCPLSASSSPPPPTLCQPWPRPSPRAPRGFGAGGRGPGSVRSGPSPPPPPALPLDSPFFFYSNTQNGEWTCNSWSNQPIGGHNPADRRQPRPIDIRSLVGSAYRPRATLAATNRALPAALRGGAKFQDRPPSGTDTNLSLRLPDMPRPLPYNK